MVLKREQEGGGLRAAGGAWEQLCSTIPSWRPLHPAPPLLPQVCELDIMFSLDTTHHIIDEMIANGCVVETNKAAALTPVQLLERIQ